MALIAGGLYVLAYLSAVIDGTRQRTGNFPEAATGPVGFRRYSREHPWVVGGAVCGVAGTVLVVLAA
jgi:hypothetical protein